MEKYTDSDLIKELNSRGWKTDLLYHIADVDSQIQMLNEDRDENTQIVLDDNEKSDILDDTFDSTFDYVCEKINIDIQDKILNYVES